METVRKACVFYVITYIALKLESLKHVFFIFKIMFIIIIMPYIFLMNHVPAQLLFDAIA